MRSEITTITAKPTSRMFPAGVDDARNEHARKNRAVDSYLSEIEAQDLSEQDFLGDDEHRREEGREADSSPEYKESLYWMPLGPLF